MYKYNNSILIDYYIRNVPDLLVFDRNSSPLDESRALVPKGDRPLLRRGARTNFKRNSSVTAPNRPLLMNRKSESDFINEQQLLELEPMVRSASADEGVTLSDHEIVMEMEKEPLSPVVEEVRDLCIATRELETPLPKQPIVMARSASTSTATTTSSRKSSWSWAFWSDEKSSKKNNKIDPVEEQLYIEQQQQLEQENRQPEVSKSSDAALISSTSGTERGKRFTLSSLFSRKSKHSNVVNMDSIISSSTVSNEAPKDFQLNRMHMTRLPLHVERAIYKLSHIKLANPRRPLHEQVLISNQMFWYLSIIATNPPENQQQHHHHRHQPQKKKKPRKLVKKQGPPQQRKESSSKLTNNVIVSGGTFMANKSTRDTSTGFVVPDNYLNPKYQKKKPGKSEYDPKQSDSSSDDDDDDEDDDDDDDGQQDDLPLALYKSASQRVK